MKFRPTAVWRTSTSPAPGAPGSSVVHSRTSGPPCRRTMMAPSMRRASFLRGAARDVGGLKWILHQLGRRAGRCHVREVRRTLPWGLTKGRAVAYLAGFRTGEPARSDDRPHTTERD